MDPELQGNGVDQNVANEVVNDNLGFSADDLGIDRDNIFEDLDLGDEGDEGFDDLTSDSGQQQQSAPPQQRDNQNNQQQQNFQPQQQQPQTRIPQYALVKPDQKGNLVDSNGSIIARAGAEARHYQKFSKHFEAPLRSAAQQISQARQSAETYQNNLNQAVEIGQQLAGKIREMSAQNQQGLEQQFGISRDELIQAATFARQAKSDPASALKSLLTMAAARGIDLKSVLGPNAQSPQFDLKAVTDLIKGEIATAVKPLQDRTAQEQQQTQQREAFQQEVTRIQTEAKSFFSGTPDAVPFLEAFRAIKTDPNLRNLSMSHIWSEIQLKLAKAGHTPQSYINMMRSKQQRPNGGTMPQGRPRASIQPDGPRGGSKGGDMAAVSTSYEDIVRDLLRSN
jgi:hypothetical protein